MSTGQYHVMIERTHREASEQAFVVDFKKTIANEIDPMCRELADSILNRGGYEKKDSKLDDHVFVRRRLEEMTVYQDWIALVRAAQDMMWSSITSSVDRQIDTLIEKSNIDEPKGSVTTDPDFIAPKYITARDVHRMPGNYTSVYRDKDVRQGAVYDCGGLIYSQGGTTGSLNDVRGHTLVTHLFTRFPDLKPERLLEIGCSAGNSSVAIASNLPDTEMYSIDIGAALVQYAHARAEHMGTAIHFSQQDAANTNFDDGYFDVVCSCVMLHETSNKAVKEIFEECHRVLRPGGVMIHLEVPYRYEDLDLWSHIRADYEAQHNNEPFWKGFLKIDLDKIAKRIGFDSCMQTFQDATPKAKVTGGKMRDESLGVHRSWYVYSALKPG